MQGTVTLRNISTTTSGLYQCTSSNAIGKSTCLLNLQVVARKYTQTSQARVRWHVSVCLRWKGCYWQSRSLLGDWQPSNTDISKQTNVTKSSQTKGTVRAACTRQHLTSDTRKKTEVIKVTGSGSFDSLTERAVTCCFLLVIWQCVTGRGSVSECWVCQTCQTCDLLTRYRCKGSWMRFYFIFFIKNNLNPLIMTKRLLFTKPYIK